ncbi:uncharacterized protein LOC144427244 [Styela clava]
MTFIKAFRILCVTIGLVAEKIPDGVCVTKIVNGKVISIGDCKKNDGSDIVKQIQKSLQEKQIEKNCDMTYNSKRFKVVLSVKRNVNFIDAQSFCKGHNYKNVANISKRSLIRDQYTRLFGWTGMRHQNGHLIATSGGNILLPTELWYPDKPYLYSEFTNVFVLVYEDSLKSQGLWNNRPSYTAHGAICEK